MNIINRHDTHSESERIQKEYTEHLLYLTDNQYYSEEYPSNQLQYSIPDPDYYRPSPRRSHIQPCDPAGYYPPPQIQQTFSTGTHVEEESTLFYMDIDLLEKRPNQQKVGKPGKCNRILNNEFES